MKGNTKGAEILRRRSRIPASRWQYYADADRDVVAEIDRGLLFLMAFWSGPSLQSFSRLTAALESFEEDEISLTVVDMDGADDLCQLDGLRQIACLYGTGELAFVRGGQIRQIVRGGHVSQAAYEAHIKSFLSECSGE